MTTEALRNAIQQVDGWKTKTAAELLAAITVTNYVKKPTDQRVWSISGIAKDFGTAVAEAIYAALVASSLPGIAARFAATGLDTTDPQWLANADALIAGPLSGLDPSIQASLKWIGHNAVVLYSEAVTEQQVAAAKSQLIEREAIEALKAEIENTWLNPALADATSVAATVRAAIKAGL